MASLTLHLLQPFLLSTSSRTTRTSPGSICIGGRSRKINRLTRDRASHIIHFFTILPLFSSWVSMIFISFCSRGVPDNESRIFLTDSVAESGDSVRVPFLILPILYFLTRILTCSAILMIWSKLSELFEWDLDPYSGPSFSPEPRVAEKEHPAKRKKKIRTDLHSPHGFT